MSNSHSKTSILQATLASIALLTTNTVNASAVKQIPNPYPVCFEQAAKRVGVSPLLLTSFGCVESKFNANAINRANKNGSTDYGLMQINSGELPRLAQRGIGVEQLMEPCTNIQIGAEVLAQKIKSHGNSWRAIGAYNAASESKRQTYAWKVYRIMKSGVCA
ncbi:MAG: lytic transglycosylase domain-containing protein [Thiotrichales bacterium]|nr:lytic transglycosylase domain-containing protein [Thiotrichales bacterium]